MFSQWIATANYVQVQVNYGANHRLKVKTKCQFVIAKHYTKKLTGAYRRLLLSPSTFAQNATTYCPNCYRNIQLDAAAKMLSCTPEKTGDLNWINAVARNRKSDETKIQQDQQENDHNPTARISLTFPKTPKDCSTIQKTHDWLLSDVPVNNWVIYKMKKQTSDIDILMQPQLLGALGSVYNEAISKSYGGAIPNKQAIFIVPPITNNPRSTNPIRINQLRQLSNWSTET